MRILHLNTFSEGGAARACIRLHTTLLSLGVDTRLLTLYGSRIPMPRSAALSNGIGGRIRTALTLLRDSRSAAVQVQNNLLEQRPNGCEIFSFPHSPFGGRLMKHPWYQSADIIHLHWVAGFVDYASILSDQNRRFVWTLHDMNPFTGGCHYSEGCTRFREECNPCPQLECTSDDQFAKEPLAIKIAAASKFSSPMLVCASPSVWLSKLARSSRVLEKFTHRVIANGIDSSIFRPVNPLEARKRLNISLDKKVILLVCHSGAPSRKGYELLLSALQLLQNRNNYLLCTAGEHLSVNNCGIPLINLGFVKIEADLAAVYSAADVLALPSTEDNLPNTMIEALMCGTPVIGFPIGGVKETIKEGVNGLICNGVSAKDFAESLEKFLTSTTELNRDMIRKFALIEFDAIVQAKKYLDIYESLQLTEPMTN